MFNPSDKNNGIFDGDLASGPLFSQDDLDLAMMGFFANELDGAAEEPEEEELETNLLYSMDNLELFLCTSDELEKEAARRRERLEKEKKA